MSFDGTSVPRVIVEFGTMSGGFIVGTTLVGSTVIDGSLGFSQVDQSLVRSIDIRRGRKREDQNFDVGVLTVEFDNHDGQFDPDNTASIWASSGTSALRYGLTVRIVVQTIISTVVTNYVIYQGQMESVTVDQGFDATAIMTVVDAIGVLSNVILPSRVTAWKSGETTSNRVNRLLDYANHSNVSGHRTIQGTVALLDTTEGISVTQAIQECSNAQTAKFYATRTGGIAFMALADKFTRPFRLWFSDDNATDTVEYDNLITSPGALYVVNTATVTRTPSTNVTATYKPSVTKYGTQAITVAAPILDTVIAHKTAAFHARHRAIPLTRMTSIEFDALKLGAQFDQFLSMELGDYITVQRTTVDGRTIIVNLTVEGFDQSIASDKWRVVIYTSPLDSHSI